MDNTNSKDGYFDVDIEKGLLSCDDLGSNEGVTLGLVGLNQTSGVRDNEGSIELNDSEGLTNVNLVIVDKVGVERGRNVSGKKTKREKPKAISAKKPPKPPRPPKGISLDLADQKLIRELHELAKFKHARIERMKALKKAKEAKGVSSKNQVFATLLTVLFCLVFLFQGLSSRTNSAINFHVSPMSQGSTEDTMISVQSYPILTVSNLNEPSSKTSRLSRLSSSHNMPEHISTAVG